AYEELQVSFAGKTCRSRPIDLRGKDERLLPLNHYSLAVREPNDGMMECMQPVLPDRLLKRGGDHRTGLVRRTCGTQAPADDAGSATKIGRDFSAKPSATSRATSAQRLGRDERAPI